MVSQMEWTKVDTLAAMQVGMKVVTRVGRAVGEWGLPMDKKKVKLKV
jgi:hypothetical protein